jgi:ABC-2 type transport system ATP-binding protein
VIEIKGLGFGYRKPLYESFDLQLSSPGLYGLFGRNGSGKSTLLKLITGLLFPKSGQIRVCGHDPQRRHPDMLASVYFVPEEFHLPNLSCERLARLHSGFYPRFRRATFEEALNTFDVDHQQPFDSMSLGTKKKAVIAFALATLTPILLLDEPTNGMDIVGRDQFRELLRRPEQADRIVLISTHQAHDLEQVISQILFINSGRLALQSSMEQLARTWPMGIAGAEGPVQLELLYRALCRTPEAVLANVKRGEVNGV